MTGRSINVPDFMRYRKGVRETSQVFLLRASNGDFDPDSPSVVEQFNLAVSRVLDRFERFRPNPPVLLKVHIGEPRNVTAMRPALTKGAKEYLLRRGCDDFFFGDTTVLYTGPRGYHQNGPRAKSYLDFAKSRGWTRIAPFVVLDRPQTSRSGLIEFDRDEVVTEIETRGRFRRFALSGGFAACGSVINHVHLTLHGLAHLALSVKGLTMGLASRGGKLAMHQSYHPNFQRDNCTHCGSCIEGCPEGAIFEHAEGKPDLDSQRCIGCGECVVVCPTCAIEMQAAESIDWTKGTESLAERMVDYVMGLMDGRWENLINIAHLYDITDRCDCVDERMDPICENLGFLIGQNPFAVDCAARRWLEESLHQKYKDRDGIRYYCPEDTGCGPFDYVYRQYGVITEPDVVPIEIKVNS